MKRSTKKRPILLIEVLIAFALVSILSTFLFVAFRYVSASDHLNEQEEREESNLSNAHQTLLRVFSNAVIENVPGNNQVERFFFFTSDVHHGSEKGKSLIFTYDNGVDRDPRFSKEVLAKLYVDQRKRLCLSVWPLPSRWEIPSPQPVRNEVLLNNVVSIEYFFYYPPSQSTLEVNPRDIQRGQIKPKPLPGEQSDWLREYRELPRILKLKIVQESLDHSQPPPIEFSFLLPAIKKTIIIKGERVG